MDKLIIIVLAVLIILYLTSAVKEHFDNTSNIQLKDLAAYECKHLGEEAKEINKLMSSCNAPNKGQGQRETINDKWQCVDNVNRKIFNDRERNLWCAAKDDKPFVSNLDFKVSPAPAPQNDNDIEATSKVSTIPIGMIQNDFDSLNKSRNQNMESQSVNFNGQLNTPTKPIPESPKPLAPASPDFPLNLSVASKEHFGSASEAETKIKSPSNFVNDINTDVIASGMLNKYDLFRPPYLEGVDASIRRIYSEVQ